MATERKLHKVWVFPAVWHGKGLSRASGHTIRSYSSYGEIPQWIMERIAVLRLLEQNTSSPLGMWRVDAHSRFVMDHDYLIVRQPGDPKWGEW